VEKKELFMSTLPRLRKLLAAVLRIDEDEVMPDSSIAQLFDRHGGDSLDRVEFVMAVEEEFDGLEVTDEEAERWEEWFGSSTVQQLAEFIDRHRRPPP
jgi:acyl carrier protein